MFISDHIELLLTFHEAHPDLSARTTPILNDIFSLLEPVSKESTEETRALAREARMVMTARLASTSSSATSSQTRRKPDEETPEEIYQKALKLLQDPILPIRAHGLLLLRQLVSSRPHPTPSRPGELGSPQVDRALIPAVLSIFLQAVQDDDSYIYLNGVQGLAAMVDGFGKETLKGLIGVYRDGLDGLGGGDMKKEEVDVKLRIAEAVEQVIKRCGDALPAYGESLRVPLLFFWDTCNLLFLLSGHHYPCIDQDVALVVPPYNTSYFRSLSPRSMRQHKLCSRTAVCCRSRKRNGRYLTD